MSEKILDAIIQLLAISAHLDGVTIQEKNIIRKFLAEQISEDHIGQYMHKFDVFAARAEKINAFQIFKAINSELTQQQKVVVIANLLDLTVSDGTVSNAEAEYADTVAQAFNFEDAEYQLIKRFIISPELNDFDPEQVVFIDNDIFKKDNVAYKHIFREKIEGKIAVLRIPSLETYLLRYESGKSNIYLNGIALRNHQTYIFPTGSSLRSDKNDPIYYSDVVTLFLNEHRNEKLSFEVKNLTYRFSSNKIALHDINLSEESGKLVGFMGASGSGKSTLLNVLNGNYVPSQGKVLINGIDIHKDQKRIEGLIGYVPQDDLLIEELTVFQNLYYAAKLCFSHYSEEQLDALVLKTLQNLGLSETKDLKVGNVMQKTISGGQRKRLNIGLELLREPAVLFVDEPTSGLSSLDSENIMDLLKELSLRGKLIFVVIHQPSSDIFKMFDKLFILDVGGFPIYYGNPVEAIVYFKTMAHFVDKEEGSCVECGNVNPEQIFSIIETKVVNEYGRLTTKRKVSPRKWNDNFKSKIILPEIKPNLEEPVKTLKIPSRIKQSTIYFTRDVLAKLSNTQYLTINLLEAPILALILAYIVRFHNTDESLGEIGYNFNENMNIIAFIFMGVIISVFIGLTVSAEEIIKDAKINKREAFLNLSRNSYLTAKIAILFGFSAIQTFCFVLVGHWVLDINGMFCTYWAVFFSCACFANVLGLNISATFNSVITIYIIIPILLIPQLILGGVVVNFDEINPSVSSQDKVPVVGDIMASRWGFEAIVVSQFKDNEYEKMFYQYDKKLAEAEYMKVYYLPALESKLAYSFSNLKIDSLKNDVDAKLRVLRNEFKFEKKTQFSGVFADNEKLTRENLTKEIHDKTKKYLQELQITYIKSYNKIADEKDKLMARLTQTPAQKKVFQELKKRYSNEKLEQLVKNTADATRLLVSQDRIIQKINPIYFTATPEDYFSFRTHFFAPKKHFMGRYYDTLYFNIIVIWVMSLLLYVTLYFELFKKILDNISAIIDWTKLQKQRKKKLGK